MSGETVSENVGEEPEEGCRRLERAPDPRAGNAPGEVDGGDQRRPFDDPEA